MDTLSELRVFVRVVEAASFAKPGESLGLSRSQVSRIVAGLEQRLGVRLLHRTTRQVAVTATGQAFFDDAAPLISGLEAAEARVRGEARVASGTLRISLPHAFGVRYLTPLLISFQAAHPEVHIRAQFDDRKVDLLAEGFDLAIRGGHMLDGAFMARALWDFRLLPVASPAFLARHAPIVEPEALARLPCLLYSGADRPDVWTLVREDERSDVRVSGPFTFSNGVPLFEAALAGMGVAILPDWLVGEALAEGRLTRVLPAWTSPTLRFWLLRPDRQLPPERVRAFQDHLFQTFPEPPWLAVP
jgi:DNA-binding transcriptional LysR family regulator